VQARLWVPGYAECPLPSPTDCLDKCYVKCELSVYEVDVHLIFFDAQNFAERPKKMRCGTRQSCKSSL
jgi:hypothetical protein